MEHLFAPTTLIALTVGVIAFQQYALARNKFKLDRYDKRYQIYEVARNFLEAIEEYSRDNIEVEECYKAHRKLKSRVDDALFVLDTQAYQYLYSVQEIGYFYLMRESSNRKYISEKHAKGISVNNPMFLEKMRISNDFRMNLFRNRYQLTTVFSKFLVVDDSLFYDKYFYTLSGKLTKIRRFSELKLNVLCLSVLGSKLFPLDKTTRQVIRLVIISMLFVIWIIAK